MQSETFQNLGRSFAGESQAHMRYLLYAKQAKKEGFDCLSKLIQSIAKNEMQHAKLFLDHLNKQAPSPISNLTIDAGYPMIFKTLEENLQAAMEGEQEENTIVYPNFSQIATNEGFAPIATTFSQIAVIEGHHKELFEKLHTAFSEGTLYQSAKEVCWECSVCGHQGTGFSPWEICPVCSHPQGYVKLLIGK